MAYKSMTDDELVEKVKSCYQESDDHSSDWREEALGLYDLVAGKQWDAVDEVKLEEQQRPHVTFNLAAKYLDAVSGLQIANRQEIRYTPRIMGEQSGSQELLTDAVKWSREQCDAETEESEAFMDCVVTGMGWTEDSISFDDNPDGMLMTERRDNLEMFWDPNSRKRNIMDARWLMRIRFMVEDEFEERYPGKLDELTDPMMGLRVYQSGGHAGVHIASDAWKYAKDATATHDTKQVPVFEYQYFEMQNSYKFKTKMGDREVKGGQVKWFEDALKAEGVPYSKRKVRRKVYYRCFVAGGIVLKRGESPFQKGFTYHCITGKRERNSNTWHGIGRALRDPQKWVNKFFSDILYIIQTNAKGGIIAEEDAFADPKRVEDEWGRPDSIVWAESGAIAQNKIMPKPQAAYPQGLDRLMTFAMNAMPETTGMNMEIMGMANRTQPGIVESQRKAAAMTVLQWAFDSMRRYYFLHGKVAAEYVKTYLADGRLIRIGGQDAQQYVKLLREDLTYEYDMIVDEAPYSSNMKDKVFGYMLEMLPYMAKSGMNIPPEFFEYSPLPTKMVSKLLERMQPDPEQVEKQKSMQDAAEAKGWADAAAKAAEVGQKRSVEMLNTAKARQAGAKTGQLLAGGE